MIRALQIAALVFCGLAATPVAVAAPTNLSMFRDVYSYSSASTPTWVEQSSYGTGFFEASVSNQLDSQRRTWARQATYFDPAGVFSGSYSAGIQAYSTSSSPVGLLSSWARSYVFSFDLQSAHHYTLEYAFTGSLSGEMHTALGLTFRSGSESIASVSYSDLQGAIAPMTFSGVLAPGQYMLFGGVTASLQDPGVPFFQSIGSIGGTFNLSMTEMAAPIPEPETYAMMLAGLGLLGVAARRRKAKETAARRTASCEASRGCFVTERGD